jgi:hypothetical protein
MITDLWQSFFWGALCLASWVAGVFFLGFWRQSRDRLFLFFTAAFWLMTLNRLGLAITGAAVESRHEIYLFRLAAFVTLTVGIVDKNRRSRS